MIDAVVLNTTSAGQRRYFQKKLGMWSLPILPCRHQSWVEKRASALPPKTARTNIWDKKMRIWQHFDRKWKIWFFRIKYAACHKWWQTDSQRAAYYVGLRYEYETEGDPCTNSIVTVFIIKAIVLVTIIAVFIIIIVQSSLFAILSICDQFTTSPSTVSWAVSNLRAAAGSQAKEKYAEKYSWNILEIYFRDIFLGTFLKYILEEYSWAASKGSIPLKKSGILWKLFTNGGGGSTGFHISYSELHMYQKYGQKFWIRIS